MKLPSMNPALLSSIGEFFVKYSGRKSVVDLETCQKVINKLDLKSKYPNSNNLSIIDVFTGEGIFSTMVNYELKPRNHVIIEKHPTGVKLWKKIINHLQSETNNRENFVLYPQDGYNWLTYRSIFDQGYASNQIKPRNMIHDEILLIANLTTPKSGESLFAQWIMCCGYKNWIQKYGRVRMICFIPKETAQKFLAGPGFKKRNKSSLKRDFITDTRLIAITDCEHLDEPNGYDYDPNVLYRDQPIVIPSEATHPLKADFAIVEVIPKDFSSECLDENDFLTQCMFISKTKPIREALAYVAPGADEYLVPILPKEMIEKSAHELTTDEWKLVFDAYQKWPFKPSLLDTTFGVVQDELKHF